MFASHLQETLGEKPWHCAENGWKGGCASCCDRRECIHGAEGSPCLCSCHKPKEKPQEKHECEHNVANGVSDGKGNIVDRKCADCHTKLPGVPVVPNPSPSEPTVPPVASGDEKPLLFVPFSEDDFLPGNHGIEYLNKDCGTSSKPSTVPINK